MSVIYCDDCGYIDTDINSHKDDCKIACENCGNTPDTGVNWCCKKDKS